MAEPNWFKQKRVAGSFGIVAFLFGFLFLDQGVTGNAIIYDSTPVMNPVALVGLLLIFCSAVLAFYSIRQK